jgi:glycosyltransferase involved in cell wall biosynthesis
MATVSEAIGTPFASTDFLLNNLTGIVVERNIEYIEQKFKEILDGKIDIDRITSNGLQYIQQFNWHNVCLRILDIVLNGQIYWKNGSVIIRTSR